MGISRLAGGLDRLTIPRQFGKLPWWLQADPNPAHCVAAYRASSQPNQATSYVNMANPGTYNLTVPRAPSWDTTDGWSFVWFAFLRTGVTIANNTWSVFLKFHHAQRAASWSQALGYWLSSSSSYIVSPTGDASGIRVYQAGTGGSNPTPDITGAGEHTMGLAGLQPYLDGATDGSPIANGGVTNALAIDIGGINAASEPANLWKGYIQYVVIYNVTISSGGASALHTAMMAGL